MQQYKIIERLLRIYIAIFLPQYIPHYDNTTEDIDILQLRTAIYIAIY